MSDYMPDVEEVRNMYASPSWVTAAQEAERYGEFDDWLNQVKADAWDEGAEALEHHQMHVSGGWPNNPYRKQEEA